MKNKTLWAKFRWGGTLLLLVAPSVFADISGTVFRDFNGDGKRDPAEPLAAGIQIKAFSASGAQCGTTQTSTNTASPNYQLAGCTGAVRVEFSIPTDGCQISQTTDFSASTGVAYGTSVQFLTDGASGKADFGVHDPAEYSGIPSFDPKIFSIAMRSGDPLVASPTAGDATYTANQSTVLAASYFENGKVFLPGEAMPPTHPESERQKGYTVLANAGQTGTLWGNTYSKQAKRLFVSAFLRRHAGLGPLGPGGIYMLNPDSPNLTAPLNFVSLDALGFPTQAASGALKIQSNAERALPAVPFNVPTHDVAAYDQVGKVSLGDLDISSDGRYLFVVNLYDRKLYRLDLQDPANPIAPTAAQVAAFALPNACDDSKAGEFRPFGLKIYHDKLYVGSVCSGEDSSGASVGTAADMKLSVHSFHLADMAATPGLVYTQSMAYRDGDVLKTGAYSAQWESWTKNFTSSRNEPMLTDIEFDNDGNLLVGLTDRNSYQTGSSNYSTDTADTNGYHKVYANGDILKLNKSAGCSYTAASGGFNFNDFYNDNSRWGVPYGCGETCHAEIGLGAMAAPRFPNKDEVVVTALNPVYYTSNGYATFSNDNGSQQRANEIWYDPYWDKNPSTNQGKGGGLGDLEVLSTPSPTEIGNRVWRDNDHDGIQDADEPGIDNVTVQLHCGTDPVIEEVTVDGGLFSFSNAANAPEMQPGDSCFLRIRGGQTVLAGSSLAPTNADGATDNNPHTDLRDSDAVDNAGHAEIAFTVGQAGANNHTLDFGFHTPPPLPDLKLLKTANKAQAVVGDEIEYTLTLTNESAFDATGIEVKDLLPARMAHTGNTPDAGTSYDAVTGIWQVGTLAAGQTRHLKIRAKIQ